MELINPLFNNFPRSAFISFCRDFLARLDAADPFLINAVGSARIAAFRAALARLEALMRWPGMIVINADVRKAARLLDHSLAELASQLRHFARFCDDPALIKAAERILAMLEHYGNISKQPYDMKAGTVKTLLDNMNGPFAADITALGLGGLKDALQTAYNGFKARLTEREDIERTKPKDPGDPTGKKYDTWAKAKKSAVTIFHEIAERVNSGAKLELSQGFKEFITLVNPEIERLNFEFRKIRYDMELSEPSPIPDEPFTGEERTPVPASVLYPKGGRKIKLRLGRHFDVTYKNNITAGNAYCILHGKGDYKGTKMVSFVIKYGPLGAQSSMGDSVQEPEQTDSAAALPVSNEELAINNE
jgi:hypothetical protein